MKSRAIRTERVTQVYKPFRFFDLPKELRDAVYNFLPCRSRIIEELTDKCPYRVRSRSTPKTYLLLVSRQFRREYKDRAVVRHNIFVEDTQAGIGKDLELTTDALHPSKITCDLTCVPGRHEQDLQYHVRMVEAVIQQVKSNPVVQLTIYFEFSGSDHPGSVKQLLDDHVMTLDRLTSMTDVKLLGIYVRKYLLEDEGKSDCKLVARYTQERRWVEYDTSEHAN